MNVKLLHHTPLWVAADAIRTCWDSGDKSDTTAVMIDGYYEDPTNFIYDFEVPEAGDKDKALIDRVGNKMKHESVKNHVSYNFTIEGISTKTLLALTRHDVGVEFSVQSSRYTCKKKQLMFTKIKNERINSALEEIITIISREISLGGDCDDIAMLLPQSYQYNLACTFSLQALQHFLFLRLKKDAHWDIRELAELLYEAVPSEHKYLFTR